ncbi:MAG TPA: FG-GAP-like repeat-containing protein [Pyrinomonadaceae bacterium]|nr:FG-GAP-like repeat-containing protein [Pyrinomonadaceae bacterium]
MKKLTYLPGSIAILIFLLTLSLPANAVMTQRQKLTSTPRGVGAQFGNAVAVNGSTMVVGARFDGTTASQAGAAYVYVRTGGSWVQQAVLLASDGAVADKFGYSVGISENTIVVGAYNDDSPLSNAGSAYVFVRNGTTWTQQQKMTAVDGTADDQFGFAVAITGEVIVVGSNHADLPSNSEAGAAYVFLRSGTVWAQTQRLSPSLDVLLGDHFGDSVAIGANKIVVGASGDDTPFTAAGAVYVFVETGSAVYGLQQKLTIASGANGDAFGSSVAFDGSTIVGGAIEETDVIGQPAFGCAYVFTFNGSSWSAPQKLIASDGASVDRFGYSVAVSGDTIAVGAREDDTAAGPDAGSAYIYTRSGSVWTERQKIDPTDSFNGDRFGVSMAFGPNGLLNVGAAEKALTSPNGQGAVYSFASSTTTPYDFDGDGKADISIFRPSNGQWWYQQSADNVVRAATFGTSTDKPVPADYDGDHRTDIAIYRPSTGEWFILRSSNSTYFSIPFGISTDRPAPGDFDGDGMADITVFRGSQGTWYINKSSGGTQISQWGAPGDIPENADYDGDGKSDLAIFRPADGSWWLSRSTAGVFSTSFGISTDRPVPADFTGDGKTDIAVFRPANGNWYVLRSEDFSFFAVPFGANGDIPAAADYDGDGKSDVAVFRPSGANWFILRSTQGILIQQFGATGDLPAPASFVP